LWREEDERGFCGSEGEEWTKWEGLGGGGWGLLCDTPSSKKIERMKERRDGGDDDDDDDDDDMMKKRKPATRYPCSSQLSSQAQSQSTKLAVPSFIFTDSLIQPHG